MNCSSRQAAPRPSRNRPGIDRELMPAGAIGGRNVFWPVSRGRAARGRARRRPGQERTNPPRAKSYLLGYGIDKGGQNVHLWAK
jgi:hypothetical protein